jgi:hypothetical protein
MIRENRRSMGAGPKRVSGSICRGPARSFPAQFSFLTHVPRSSPGASTDRSWDRLPVVYRSSLGWSTGANACSL